MLATFRLFDFCDRPTIELRCSPSIHLILIDHRSSLALPHPILQSHYSQVFYIVAVAYIAIAKSQHLEKKAWHPRIPHLEMPCSSTNPRHHGNYGLCSFLLANGMQDMECAMRNAMDSA